MNKEQQDKLWNELSEDKKAYLKSMYAGQTEYNDFNDGYLTALTDIFGTHNLNPESLTYDDVARELYNSSAGTFGIPERDFSKKSDVKPWDYFGVYSKEAQQKVIAIIKLLNVAAFLNKNEDGTPWKPDFKDAGQKWIFSINHKGAIQIVYVRDYNSSIVYFRTKELAIQAVAILGEDTVRLALSSDY